jgi:hypothetical protein
MEIGRRKETWSRILNYVFLLKAGQKVTGIRFDECNWLVSYRTLWALFIGSEKPRGVIKSLIRVKTYRHYILLNVYTGFGSVLPAETIIANKQARKNIFSFPPALPTLSLLFLFVHNSEPIIAEYSSLNGRPVTFWPAFKQQFSFSVSMLFS